MTTPTSNSAQPSALVLGAGSSTRFTDLIVNFFNTFQDFQFPDREADSQLNNDVLEWIAVNLNTNLSVLHFPGGDLRGYPGQDPSDEYKARAALIDMLELHNVNMVDDDAYTFATRVLPEWMQAQQHGDTLADGTTRYRTGPLASVLGPAMVVESPDGRRYAGDFGVYTGDHSKAVAYFKAPLANFIPAPPGNPVELRFALMELDEARYLIAEEAYQNYGFDDLLVLTANGVETSGNVCERAVFVEEEGTSFDSFRLNLSCVFGNGRALRQVQATNTNGMTSATRASPISPG